jgi:hypothetical protein
MISTVPVLCAPGIALPASVGAGMLLASDRRMLTMMTMPGLTLVFLLVVLSLGIAFVWMLWEMEQLTKARLAKVRRDSWFG